MSRNMIKIMLWINLHWFIRQLLYTLIEEVKTIKFSFIGIIIRDNFFLTPLLRLFTHSVVSGPV